MNSKSSFAEIHDAIVSYHHRPVLWNVDLVLPAGKIIGILGPNGAGKSTLLKAMLGLIPLNSGWIQFWGAPLDQNRKKISYVPQREAVDWDFPITVEEVVMMGRYPHMGLWKRARKEDKKKVEEALELVGLSAVAKRQIGQLSGGQQQRVFWARSLAQDAQGYLMDEPTSDMDAPSIKSFFNLLRKMTQAGKTFFIAFHNLSMVKEYFDWLVLLNVHVVASGPTEKVFTPEILQKTYGSDPSLLLKAGQLFQQYDVPPRTEAPSEDEG